MAISRVHFTSAISGGKLAHLELPYDLGVQIQSEIGAATRVDGHKAVRAQNYIQN